MDHAIRNIWTLGVILLIALSGCRYDLDVTGVVSTSNSVNERFTESIAMHAHPARYVKVPGDTYHVFFGGDSHMGGLTNMKKLLQLANDEEAVALAIAGDVTTGKEDDYIRADSLFRAETVNVQLCLLPGNHDLYFGGWESFHELFGGSVYTMIVESADTTDLFIFLDSGSGTLGGLQLQWLEDLLSEQRGEFRYVIVTTHLNFFRNRMTGSTNPLNEELLFLLDLFAQYEVDLLISGHDHDRYIEEFGLTTYITLDAMKDDVPQASYLDLEVTGEGYEYGFVGL